MPAFRRRLRFPDCRRNRRSSKRPSSFERGVLHLEAGRNPSRIRLEVAVPRRASSTLSHRSDSRVPPGRVSSWNEIPSARRPSRPVFRSGPGRTESRGTARRLTLSYRQAGRDDRCRWSDAGDARSDLHAWRRPRIFRSGGDWIQGSFENTAGSRRIGPRREASRSCG